MDPRTKERLLFEFKERAREKVFIRIIYYVRMENLGLAYYLFTVTDDNKICSVEVSFEHQKDVIIGTSFRKFPDDVHEDEYDVIEILANVADSSDTDASWEEALFFQIDAKCTQRIGGKLATKVMFLADLMRICEMLTVHSNTYPNRKPAFELLEHRLRGFLEEQFRSLDEIARLLSKLHR